MCEAYIAIVVPPGSEKMRKMQNNKDNSDSVVFVGTETQCFEVEDEQKNKAVIPSHSRFSIYHTQARPCEPGRL